MSILIKDMEMPTSCAECQMGDPVRCVLMPGVPAWWAEYDQCVIEKRLHSHCPLIPVPPHGRLIESVELYGRAEDIKTKAISVCDKLQPWQFGVFWAIEQIEAALTNAPTIIPAEEGE